MPLADRLALALASAAARLVPRRRRTADEQGRIERAVAAVDRELAGNLELVTMYMQTKQPAVLENAAYRVAAAEIARADRQVAARLASLYEGLGEAESAMERRGPAGSIRSDDRATVQRWEGDARVLQRELRRLPGARPASWADRLLARTRDRARRTPAR